MTILGKHERVTVPTLNVGGWYDIFLKDTIENFRTMRQHGSTPEARQSKLLIGPWAHGSNGNPVGEMNFGLGSTVAFIDLQIDFMSLQLRWFDQFLKGADTGILREAPIKLFVMGANTWRDEQEWPLARAIGTRYYLHSNGHANTSNGDGALSAETSKDELVDRYDFDPANPVITRGGALLMSPEFPAGPFDQRSTEGRNDVLVYSTPVLEQDMEVTGPVSVHLWATSNLFKQGHRIRLDVTSSNFPRWDRNPNTGHDFGADDELAVAHQTILHDAEHPSYVTLPVVPLAAS